MALAGGSEQLIVFTRYPQPGAAKTRLIPALGPAGAALLHRQLAEHTLQQIQSFLPGRSTTVEIWFAGTAQDVQPMADWLGKDWAYQLQPSGDLGDRMATAFQTAFAAGCDRVVLIGTDCPGLDAEQIRAAFTALDDHDVVLGPATDGGYYLIGLRRLIPDLFVGIAWSTDSVFAQTVAIAQANGLSIHALPPLSDIDWPEDLPIWYALARPRISVIIPALNEAATIAATLTALQGTGVEVIIVDGGSQDDTVAQAMALEAKVIQSPRGRATQMNAGADAASGDLLLFLHADTQLPPGFVDWVRHTLAQPGVVAGAFELRIGEDMPGLRLVEWGVKWRSHLWQLPYGDQAIFLTAATFRQLGGFPDQPIMEDFELVRRARRLGKVAIAPVPVITSGRRWRKLGILRTTGINQLMVIAYALGISPHWLADWYRGRSQRPAADE